MTFLKLSWKLMKVEELAEYYVSDFTDITEHPDGRERKGIVYALIDRRTGIHGEHFCQEIRYQKNTY